MVSQLVKSIIFCTFALSVAAADSGPLKDNQNVGPNGSPAQSKKLKRSSGNGYRYLRCTQEFLRDYNALAGDMQKAKQMIVKFDVDIKISDLKDALPRLQQSCDEFFQKHDKNSVCIAQAIDGCFIHYLPSTMTSSCENVSKLLAKGNSLSVSDLPSDYIKRMLVFALAQSEWLTSENLDC